MSAARRAAPRHDAQDAETIGRIFHGFARGRAGDVEEVRRWIGGIVHRGNWNFADAEGVVQEIVVELYGIARAGKVRDPGSFKKFVYSVARHACTRTYYRERRRPERAELDDAPETAAAGPAQEEGLLHRERLDAMVYVFQRLPEQCRKLWTLLYGEGLDAGTAAKRLGITANNVRVRAHRCLTRAREIRRRFETWPAGEESG